ncbi:MAG TPA: stage II sporulation protein D [Clostridiales bacterium]|nr:stage II sporulation protein D [Clostridiales bacterium]
MKKLVTVQIVFILMIVLIPFLLSKSCHTTSEDKVYVDVKIKVWAHEAQKVVEMDLEDYLLGVVAAEMPAAFEQEALNAQAVAARTYAVARLKGLYVAKDGYHPDTPICTDPSHCQGYKTKEQMSEVWGKFSTSRYWKKIQSSVEETIGQVITYKEEITNPVYHSNAGGITESASDVWGTPVPYLVSVMSKGDSISPVWDQKVTFTPGEIRQKITSNSGYSDFNLSDRMEGEIETIEHTSGGGVKSIRLGNKIFEGTELRRLLGLKSTKFEISIDKKGIIHFRTKGSGHGVGMSQWGANYLALNGGTYIEILEHYYNGIIVKSYR